MKKLLLILLCVPLIGFGQQTNVSTQNTDTIRFLDKVITINDINTNREYYQAMLSLIDKEIKNDSTNKVLKEIKYYYNMLIQGTEDFNIESLSNSAGKIETNLQQYLINSPEKVQFHINKGKKYDTGGDLEIYDKEYQKRGYFPMPDGTGEID
jgi:hypothetical protein